MQQGGEGEMPPKPVDPDAAKKLAEEERDAAEKEESARAAEKLKLEAGKAAGGGGVMTELPLATVAPAQQRPRPNISWP